MNIKTTAQPWINTAATESASTPDTPSPSSKLSTGVASIADRFEAPKASPSGSILNAGSSPLATKLTEAKSEISRYLQGQEPLGSYFPATDNVFAFMIQYQKMLNKEYREDKKTALSMKDAQLDAEKERIGAMKKEAGQRYDDAMAAANNNMVLGASAGAADGAASAAISPIQTAINELKQYAESIKPGLVQNNQGDSAAIDGRFRYLISWLDLKGK